MQQFSSRFRAALGCSTLACLILLFACSAPSGIDPARIPELPELSGESTPLVQVLSEARSTAVTTPTAESIMDLGRTLHANNIYREASLCYELVLESGSNDPRSSYLLAHVFRSMGQPDRVEELLTQTVDLAPTYAPALLELANHHFKLGELDLAEAEFERALELSPEDPHARFGLGRVANSRKEWTAAREHLEAVIEIDPSFSSAYRVLAGVLDQIDETERAKELREASRGQLRFLPPEDPWMDDLLDLCHDSDQLLALADRALQQRDGLLAGEYFRRAREAAPDNPQVYQIVGKKLYRAGAKEAALESLRQAVELAPDDAEMRIDLGAHLGLEKQFAEAEATLRKAIELFPTADLAYAELAKVLEEQGRRDEATALFEKAIEVSPHCVEAHVNIGFILYDEAHVETATQHWREALDLDPRNARAHFGLGVYAISSGDEESAINHFEQAVRKNPNYLGGHFQLALLFDGQGDRDRTRRHYREVVRIDDRHRDANAWLMVDAAKRADSESATRHLNAALRGDSEDVSLELDVARAWVEEGDLSNARGAAERALAKNPESSVAHEILGVVRLREGSYDLAIQEFRTVLQSDPQNAYAHYNLAQAFAGLGNDTKAVQEHEAALRAAPGWELATNSLAWILATSPDETVRDADRAVELAKAASALADSPSPFLLDTLATAYAAADRFEDAIRTAEQALALARASGPKWLATDVAGRLELFRENRAFESPAP